MKPATAIPPRSHYDILEVNPRASLEVIQAAYRALMKRHHPDVKATRGDRTRQLNEAYAVLSDPAARRRYDDARGDIKGKVLGDFRVVAPIAEGGFGKTYKGEHVLVGEPVCIKHCSRISVEDEAVLIGEAKAMWDMRHFAIPAVRDLLRLDDGSLALVMSFIEGPTLDKLVEKNGRLDPEHVAWITERILNALMYLHYHGVVHGDLKPQNIIVQPESHTVVLVDFGLAMVKPKRDSESLGYTDLFAPPEQMRAAPLLPQTDFYSLGMTMIHALGGGMDHVEKKRVPTDVPDPLCEFVRRLIVRDTLSRPDWTKEDLCKTIQQVRQQSFGRISSSMKTLKF